MQIRYFNYKEDDATFLLNSRWVGILEPAVYRGFDNITREANLDLILEHFPTGIQPTAQDTSQSGRVRGVLFSKQGTIIMEDEAIVLEITPGHPSLERTDLIVCSHQHVQAAGGTAAYYRVLVGVPGQGSPALSEPGKQTIVGWLTVPAGTTDMLNPGIAWLKNIAELAGRPPYTLPASVAHWTRKQSWSLPQFFSGIGWQVQQQPTDLDVTMGAITIGATTGMVFFVTATGDLKSLFVPAARRGEIFYLRFTAAARLVRGQATLNGSLLLPTADIVVNPGDGALFLILDDGSAMLLHMQLGDPARLTQVNRFKRTQQQSRGGAQVVDLAPQGLQGFAKVDLDTNGNAYLLTVPTGLYLKLAFMTEMPEGTQITLITTQPSRLPYASLPEPPAPDWGFAQYSGPALPGYQTLQFPKFSDGNGVGAQSAAPTAFSFLSFNGAWVLTSVAAALPVQQHDRKKQVTDPIPGGSGYIQVPTTGGGTTITLHTYKTPDEGGMRDYLVQHTFDSYVTGTVAININFYRNGALSFNYAMRISDYQSDNRITNSSWLFENVLPGEQLEVRAFCDTQNSNNNGSLRVTRSVAIWDGTPSVTL